jgi:hypothetical protein
MDGLSVAASIAGPIQVTAKIIDFISTTAEASMTARNVLAEVNTLQAIFHQLQDFILNFEEAIDDRRSMIHVNQLVATLTGCVCAIFDLEKVLESLNVNNVNNEAGSVRRLWDNAQWVLKD